LLAESVKALDLAAAVLGGGSLAPRLIFVEDSAESVLVVYGVQA